MMLANDGATTENLLPSTRSAKHYDQTEESGARLLRRAGYFRHHSLAQGELRLRGGRGLRRYRPGRRRTGRPGREGPQDRRLGSLRRGHARGVRQRNTCGSWCARAASTSTSTCWAPPSRGRCWPRSRWKWRWRTGCDGLAHGCTGKGNDQVRFELTYKALAPQLPVIAPWREWNIVSREDAIEYARDAQRAHLAIHHQDLQPRPQHLAHLARRRRAGRSGQRRAGRNLDADASSPREAPDKPARSDHRLRRGRAGFGRTASA